MEEKLEDIYIYVYIRVYLVKAPRVKSKRRRIEKLVRRRNKIKSPSAVAKAILGEAPEPETLRDSNTDSFIFRRCLLQCVELRSAKKPIYLVGAANHQMTGAKLPSNRQILAVLFFNI